MYDKRNDFRFSIRSMVRAFFATSRYFSATIMTFGVLLLGLLAVSLLACDRPEKASVVYRVGIICGGDFFIPVIDGFKAKMDGLGFIDSRNINYTVEILNDDPDGERRAAEKFVKDGVDLIFAVPTKPSIIAHKVIKDTDIPLVFAYAGIEGANLVERVSKPGGNTTGVRFPGPEQECKVLELLLEFKPEAKRIWVGYDRNYPNTMPALNALRPLSKARGITLLEAPVNSAPELEAYLARQDRAAAPSMDAIILMPDTLNHSPAGWDAIRSFAEKYKIPIGGTFKNIVEQGALFGCANDLYQVGALTAPIASKILNGTPAGTIPVVTPEPVLIINYNVAQKLGIKVPEGLLNMATRIIR